jgi:hypothetical protein
LRLFTGSRDHRVLVCVVDEVGEVVLEQNP